MHAVIGGDSESSGFRWAQRRQRFRSSLVLFSPEGSAGSPALGTRLCIAPPWWVIVRCSCLVSCGEGWEGTPRAAAPLSALYSLAPAQSHPWFGHGAFQSFIFWKPLLPSPPFLNPFPVFRRRKLTLPRRTRGFVFPGKWPRRDASHSAFRSSLPTCPCTFFLERFSVCSWMNKCFLIWPSFIILVYPLIVVWLRAK